MLKYPDEIDLLAFFECDPIETDLDEQYFCFSYVDESGVRIEFAFNAIQQFVRIRILNGENEVALVSEECVEQISIRDNGKGEHIFCLFNFGDSATSELEVYIRPRVRINWNTLRL